MPILIGISLALVIGLFALFARVDRDRSFYPTVLIVVASYYDLFGVMGGSSHALAMESAAMAVFLLLAYLAFRYSAWFAVGGLVAHGVFDWLHSGLIENPGVPDWWPSFCLAYDAAAGGFLACRLLLARRLGAKAVGRRQVPC